MAQIDKERLAEVAAKIKKKKEEEELKEIEAYDALISSQKWKVFKWLAYVAALMAILMTVDILVPGKDYRLKFVNVHVQHGFLNVDGIWFTPEEHSLQGFQEETFSQEVSVIFQEVKSVCWDSEVWQYDDEAEPIYERYCAESYNTIYSFFPGPSIAFIIPLFVVLFKRRSPWFKFFRFASWIVIFPGTLLCTLFLLM